MKNPSPVGSVKKGSPALSRIEINTMHLLYGEELEDLGRKRILVEGSRIVEISDTWSPNPTYTVDVVMPPLVNAHVHLSDARIPEKCIGLSLANYVGSKGIKHPYIKLIKKPLIPIEVKWILPLYGAVGDYQELWETCSGIREELDDLGVSYVGLSRPPDWNNTSIDELSFIASKCGGIGVSNPARIPPWILGDLREISLKHIVSAHVSETKRMEETGGLHYLLSSRIRLRQIVHGVYLERWELRRLVEENIVLVVNPRSNLWFTGRIADVEYLLENGGKIALGSDNAGCFYPDTRVEAELLYTLKPSLNPKRIVEALTINGYISLGLKPPLIGEGEPAFFIGFNIGLASKTSPNIYASIVKRLPYADSITIFKQGWQYIIDKRIM